MKTRYKPTGELKLFRIVWSISNKRSFISQLDLGHYEGTERFVNLFAHVLSKNKYPYFRLYLGNLVLLHPLEHEIYDQGTIEKRIEYSQKVKHACWDKLDTLRSELSEEYQKEFPLVSKEGIIMKYSEDEVKEKIRSLNLQHVYTLVREGLRAETADTLIRVLQGL